MSELIKSTEVIEPSSYTNKGKVHQFTPEYTEIILNRIPTQAEQEALFGGDDSVILVF